MKLPIGIAGLLACVVAHSICISMWVARDHSQPVGEVARNLIQTMRVASALAEPAPDLASRVLRAHPEPQPPLLATAGAAIHLTAPASPAAPVLAQSIFVALAAIGAFCLGMALRGPGTGLLSAILFTSTPFFGIYEHRMLADLPMAAFAACASAAFVASDGFRGRAASVALGLCAGFGMLAHWNFAFACAGIGAGALGSLVYCILRITSGTGDAADARRRIVNILIAIVCGAAVIAPWALERGAEAWQYAGQAAPAFSAGDMMYYAEHFAQESSLFTGAMLFVTLALFGISLISKNRAARPVDPGRADRALNCIIVLFGAYAALALAPMKDPRYAGLLLPAACGFIAYVLSGMAFRFVRAPFVILTAALSILTYLAVAFGIFASDDARARPAQTLQFFNLDFRAYQPDPAPPAFQPAPGRRVLALASVKNPPDPRDPDPARALDAIERDYTEQKARVFFITPQEILHGSAFEYWCESGHARLAPLLLREYYAGDPRNLDFAAFSPYELLVSHYVVLARRRGGPNLYEKSILPFNNAFTQYLTGDAPILQKHFARIYGYEPVSNPYDRANDLLVEVYRRIVPADAEEVNEILAAVNRFDRVKPGTWVDVAYFWYHSGHPEDSRKILEKNVTNRGVLAPVHRDRLLQMQREIGAK
ncbi:MAG: hypothetical protein HY286_10030 [Planctomycetes bacterium]|nr:hypothetical protein [Planctomycetota bacterium]